MMRLVARPTAGRCCEALREIAAHDREPADELAAVIGQLAREVCHRWCCRDHGAKRRMMLERMGRALFHAAHDFTAHANVAYWRHASLSMRVRAVRPRAGLVVRRAERKGEVAAADW